MGLVIAVAAQIVYLLAFLCKDALAFIPFLLQVGGLALTIFAFLTGGGFKRALKIAWLLANAWLIIGDFICPCFIYNMIKPLLAISAFCLLVILSLYIPFAIIFLNYIQIKREYATGQFS